MAGNFVYAIYSHGNPDQVLRLVRAMRALSPQSHVVVHHDPTNTPLTAQAVSSAGGIAIPNPVRGTWGDYSLVRQHLHTMRWCLDNLDFEWFITLTGQTYPIKPIYGFETQLANAKCDAFIGHFSAYDQSIWPNDEAIRRYHYRYIQLPKFRYWHKIHPALRTRIPKFIWTFNHIQPFLRLSPYPRNLATRLGLLQWHRPFSREKPLVGSNLNSNYRRLAVEHILGHVESRPGYSHYFSRTVIPDEVFFSTILCNETKIRVINDCLRHIYWPNSNAASGGTMDMTHWQHLERSAAYFALKFDENTCPELMHRLDLKLNLNSSKVTD